jgi:hypothetical protein
VPVTVDSGPQGTDDPLAVDLKISMDEKVGMVDTNTSQFGTMLMKLGASQARSFKEQWLEDEYLPTNTALSATAAAGDTNLAITTSEGAYAKAGDTAVLIQTGEAVRITTAGASAWTVVRGIGSVSAATAASGTALGGIIIVNGSNEEGAEMPTALVTEKTTNFNYTQIVRNAFRFSNTAQWNEWYSGNPLAYHRKKIAVEHKRQIEQGLFFGARSYTAGTTHPRPTYGGLDFYISTNKTDAGGTFDKGELQDFLRGGLEYGDPDRKVLFASPIVAQVCSEFLQDNWVMAPPETNVFGVKVDFLISGVVGSKIPVIVKNDWKRFGEGTGLHIGSRAYLIDMSAVELKKAPPVKAGPRYLSLYDNRQNPSADEMAEEYLSEITLVVKNEKKHARLTGVTG